MTTFGKRLIEIQSTFPQGSALDAVIHGILSEVTYERIQFGAGNFRSVVKFAEAYDCYPLKLGDEIFKDFGSTPQTYKRITDYLGINRPREGAQMRMPLWPIEQACEEQNIPLLYLPGACYASRQKVLEHGTSEQYVRVRPPPKPKKTYTLEELEGKKEKLMRTLGRLEAKIDEQRYLS